MKPLYNKDESISWVDENGLDCGIVLFAHLWNEKYEYLIKDRSPHKWIKEEQTTKYRLEELYDEYENGET